MNWSLSHDSFQENWHAPISARHVRDAARISRRYTTRLYTHIIGRIFVPRVVLGMKTTFIEIYSLYVTFVVINFGRRPTIYRTVFER